ncbi:MAG: alpha/beta hydrolase [Gammaproteobacteria bacterium]|nr:alpha/beta hydrolase [Gammaproteobacteria bacterium]
MNAIWKFLFIGACLYAGLAALIYFRQSSLLFYPNVAGRNLAATPQRIGLVFEDVDLLTSDRVRLHGWFIPADNARGTLLFFHGNAGNISHRLDSIAIFNRMNLDVFIFDYRGYGQSQGKVSETGTYRDAEAAWSYLTGTRGIDPDKVIVFGRSLGSSIAAWLASRHTPAALILESSFSSVPSMAQRLYPFLPVRWLSKFSYDTRQYVGALACPLLVVHSRNDEIIPYAEGRLVFDAAPADKQFLDLRGGHNDGFLVSGEAYIDGLRSFIDSSLQQTGNREADSIRG